MKSSAIIKSALSNYKENELIHASKLYRKELVNQISEAAFYKTLERMCKSGELVKIAKGTYHLPKDSKYGIVPPSEKEIVSAFTKNGTGTVVGYSLYNSLNLTTQIAKSIEVMSSALESFTKTLGGIAGAIAGKFIKLGDDGGEEVEEGCNCEGRCDCKEKEAKKETKPAAEKAAKK